jgi:hypothetical protein
VRRRPAPERPSFARVPIGAGSPRVAMFSLMVTGNAVERTERGAGAVARFGRAGLRERGVADAGGKAR